MKVSRSNSNPASPPSQPDAVHPALDALSKQASGVREPVDFAQLSGLGAYLAAALSGSPARMAKLVELARAVSARKYSVDSYSVSGSIIQHVIELGGTAYQSFHVLS